MRVQVPRFVKDHLLGGGYRGMVLRQRDPWPLVPLKLFAWASVIHISNILHTPSLLYSFLVPFLPPSLLSLALFLFLFLIIKIFI